MEELKVSIVVPVYNTNIEYFRQCIKSLVLQTYENIEIVIVDDGSKDENVSTEILSKICSALNCDVGDIMEFVPDKKEGQ